MRSFRKVGTLVVALGVLLAAATTASITTPPARATVESLDCGAALVEKTLKNGASWRMCARIHPVKGLVLEKIEFKPPAGSIEYDGYKRVLDQIYLALLNVPYDTGNAYYNDVPSYGFGDEFLMEQTDKICLGEKMNVRQTFVYDQRLVDRNMPGICLDEVATGLTTHAQVSTNNSAADFAEHGTGLEVSSLSKISWYEYQQKLTFDDHGAIDVALGATGDLAPGSPGTTFFDTNPKTGWPIGPPVDGQDYYAASHWHNTIYRVDFGIDEGTTQKVEQWDYERDSVRPYVVNAESTEKTTAFSSIPGASPAGSSSGSQQHTELTWWRVVNPDSLNRDGHPRSYEIVNQNLNDRFVDVASPSVSFTNNHACQEYAASNSNADCENQTVLDYVANENEPLTDPIAWVNVGFHHIVKDEDQSPMPVHWQRFQLVPRDFFAQSPALTTARICVNGPSSGNTGGASSCIATNTVRPKVTADTSSVRPGTALTATTGTWINVPTPWAFSYLWFRDGVPITDPEPATGATYTVTENDRGHNLTVKVTAAQIGYGSGTAESIATTVPGLPTPTPTTPSPTNPATPTPSKTTATVKPTLRKSSTSASLRQSKVTVKRHAKVKVTVRTGGKYATGKVRVRHGSKVLRTATLKNGRITITIPKLRKSRTYRLRVDYLGNSTTKSSHSRVLTLRVVKR